MKSLDIFELAVSDGLAHRHHRDDSGDKTKPITLIVYGGLDTGGNRTDARRFIISGGNHDQLFAAFNRDEFVSIRRSSNNQLLLTVSPPGHFWAKKIYYALKISNFPDHIAKDFVKEMSEYTSSPPVTHEASTSLDRKMKRLQL